MKRILAIYYSQSGQLKNIIDSVISPIRTEKDIEIDYLQLKPTTDYPFPWKNEFFNCFPESVKGIPCSMEPYNLDLDKDYDLILLGHQPWYLSPSIPVWSFLSSKEASNFFKGKNVVTIIGARNMWVGAQEIIKNKLSELNARLVGNIVLQDKTDNIIAGITIIKWLIHGNKGPSHILPEAGVSKKDIANASIYGKIIKSYINNDIEELQPELRKNRAVKVKYHLLNIELNARKIFCKFADLALKHKKNSPMHRKKTIKLFKGYLLFALFLVSPFFSLIFMIARVLFFPLANKKLDYYASVKSR